MIESMTDTPQKLIGLTKQLPEVGGFILDKAYMISVRLKTIEDHRYAINHLESAIGQEMSELRREIAKRWTTAEIQAAIERATRAEGGAL